VDPQAEPGLVPEIRLINVRVFTMVNVIRNQERGFTFFQKYITRLTKYGMERYGLKLLDDLTANWKRGLWAVGIFIAVWIMVFFIAFMAALGNDTPFARMTLKSVELFAIVANPLWGIPLAFLIGVYSKRK
jgi:hypothetical protein